MTPTYVADNDQWLQGGDCDICRRQKYCSKPCKRHKIRTERLTQELVAKAILKRFHKGEEGADNE